MKTNFLMTIVFTVLIVIGCKTQSTVKSMDGDVDARFVGVWTGSEKDHQVMGASKEWKISRKSDGTFKTDFVITYDGEKPVKHTESGRWWLKNGKYYEFNNYSQLTDTYTFEFLNPDQIKYKAYHLSVVYDNEEYEFTDIRVK